GDGIRISPPQLLSGRADAQGLVAPLPDIATHVVEPVAIRLVGDDRGGADPAASRGTAVREGALPDVGGKQAVLLTTPAPPRIPDLPEAAAGGILPLGFGRQPRSCPGSKCASIVERDLNHRMVAAPGDVGAWPLRRSPACTLDLPPP